MCLKLPPVASLCTSESCIIVYGEWDLVFLETVKFREECYVNWWLMGSGGSRLTSAEIHNTNIWASLKCRHCKPFWGEIYDGRDTMDEKSMETIWQEGSCAFIFWCRFCRGCVDNHWYRFCVVMTIIVDMWNQFNTPLHTLSHALNPRFMWRWPHCLKQWEEEGPTWMGLAVVVKKSFKRSFGGKFCKICWRKLEWTNFQTSALATLYICTLVLGCNIYCIVAPVISFSSFWNIRHNILINIFILI